MTTTPCVLWAGNIAKNGYGRIGVDYRLWLAHRWVFTQQVGAIPPGHEIHHRCGVRACVRLDHLVAVPAKQHRRTFHRNDRCSRGHSMADAYVYPLTGARQCRQCRNASKRASWTRHKDRYNATRRNQ